MSTIEEEQDLDAALDSILGDHQSAAAAKTTTNGKQQQQHIGAPMPKTLIEQVRQTCNNAKKRRDNTVIT